MPAFMPMPPLMPNQIPSQPASASHSPKIPLPALHEADTKEESKDASPEPEPAAAAEPILPKETSIPATAETIPIQNVPNPVTDSAAKAIPPPPPPISTTVPSIVSQKSPIKSASQTAPSSAAPLVSAGPAVAGLTTPLLLPSGRHDVGGGSVMVFYDVELSMEERRALVARYKYIGETPIYS